MIITDEDVEIAARAIYKRHYSRPWDQAPLHIQDPYLQEARAALSAAVLGIVARAAAEHGIDTRKE